MDIFTQPVSQTYTFGTATLEIAIMLVGAGVLGYLMHWAVCKMRGCCGHGFYCTAGSAPSALAAPKKAVATQAEDDIELIEGIGPKVKQVLHAVGITTFAQIATMSPKEIKAILEKGGDRFALLNPETWPYQAGLARDGKMGELEAYKKFLDNGREPGKRS